MKTLSTLLTAGFLSLSAVSANAATLDFTSTPFVGATGSIDGVGYTITTAPGSLILGGNAGPSCTGLACQTDGIGVASGQDTNEIDFFETLTITFDEEVYISGLSFLNLFENEVANVQVGGTNLSFTGVEPLFGTGFVTESFSSLFATSVTFTTQTLSGDDGDSNYYVAALEVSEVPVPAAAFLFAPALVGFMGLRRRAAKKA
jgi:hypothetical protein